MIRLQCSEIWGGNKNVDADIVTARITAGISSKSAQGECGGDIYYMSTCSADRLSRVILADVVGHGETVGEVTHWFYEVLKQHADDPDDGAILTEMNRQVVQKGIQALTVATLLSLHLGKGTCSLSYAGNRPALRFACGSKGWLPMAVEIRDKDANLPLGVTRTARYPSMEIPLGEGDRFFLCTDGLIEARSSDGIEFGEDRLRDLLDSLIGKTVKAVKAEVLKAHEQFTRGRTMWDDTSFICLQAGGISDQSTRFD